MRTILSVLLVCLLQTALATKDPAANRKNSGGSNKPPAKSKKQTGEPKKDEGEPKKDEDEPKKIPAGSANYYFSANSGNDSRSATQAQNPSTPWKTLSKLNSFFSSLQSGDRVYLKRGETFYGSINISRSGTSGSPIYIGAYGSGDRPVITSLVNLSGWKANPSNKGVYDFEANSALGPEVNIVLLNGKEKGMGRFPNVDEPNKGYLKLDSYSGKNSITDKQLKSVPNWKGAELVIRSNRWTLDRCLITSHSGTTIRYKGLFGARKGYGYFIQNHIKTLDKVGEWYYNPSTKRISMFFGSSSPSSYKVQAGSINTLVYSWKQSNIVLDNLTFKGSNGNGINLIRGNNLTVRNCDVIFSGIDGVNVSSTTNFILENSSVLNSHNNGIVVGSSNTKAIIRNNVIKNTYTIAGMGKSGNGQGVGVRINNGGLLEYNQIINTGYAAIDIGGDYTVVKNNYIDTFCTIKDDGAGIYTSNGPNKNYKGRKIVGNIVLNGIGAGAGTTSLNSSSADGIYMDDNANGFDITDNTVANCNRGLYLHNSRYIIVKNNTLFDNNSGQLYVKHDRLGKDKVRDQTVTDNIFFSKLATQKVSSINTVQDDKDIKSMGRFDNNYYSRPIDDKAVIFNATYIFSPGEKRVFRDLDGWKSQFNFDKSSKKSAKQIDPYNVKGLNGSNKFQYGDFNLQSSVPGFGNNSKLSLEKSGVLDEGYLKVTPLGKNSSYVVGIGTLSSSKKYVLKYSIKGTGTMSIGAFLRSPSYNPVTPNQLYPITTSRSEVEVVFSPNSNENRASLVFWADAQKTYYIDNIELYEADATVTNPDDSIKFVINPSQVNKTVRLDGNYVDAKNNKFSNSITLSPYTSAVLIKDDKTSAKKTGPTVSIKNPANQTRFTDPATIKVEAQAEDKDGRISKVEFYNGSKLLHTAYSAPYTYTWSNVATGNYILTAKATDNDGHVATSSEVLVAVVGKNVVGKNKIPPAVSMIDPNNNSKFTAPATINMSAKATDKDGTISKVEFYNGTRLLKTEYNDPYLYTWNDVPAGNYTITAKATDNDGNVTTSRVSISVSGARNQAPTISIVNPDNNQTFKGPATIRLVASAKDKDGKISKVQFYNGNTLLRNEYYYPYTYWWRNVPVGTYTLTAKAIDDKGVSTTSAVVKVRVVAPGESETHNRPSSINEQTDSIGKADFSVSRENLKLSPNPARNTLNISINGLPQNKELTISIVSVSGSVIKNIKSNTSNQVVQTDVSSLNNGVYIIKVVCGNKILSQQFVKL